MWQQDEILSKYKEKLVKYDYVSFDIFDTLLLRMLDVPQDIFLKLGYEAIEKGYTRKNLTSFEFQQIRILSEKSAFENNKKKIKNQDVDNEVTLKNIYNAMPRNLGDLDKIMELEIEIEKEYTYLNPVIYELIKELNDLGKEVFLISDMYLNKEEIRYILTENGFDYTLIKDLIVSSEVLLNKKSSRLFNYVLNKYKIDNSNIIHIGDNYDSDIQATRKKGIESIYYDVMSKENYEIDSEKYKYGNIIPEIKSFRKVISNLTANYTKDEKFWFKFGASILSPIFIYFSEYVIDVAIKNNIKIIRPFMREAIILEPLLKIAAKQKEYECDIQPIYVSRVSTLISSIKEIDKEFLDELFEVCGMRLIDIIDMFELNEENFDMFHSEMYKPLLKIRKEQIEQIITYIINNCKDKISVFCKEKRKLFLEYLNEQNCIGNEVITVDLGYGGTIPEYIEKALKIENIKSDMLHILMLASDRLNDKLQKGIKINSFMGLYNENIDLIETIIPLKGVLEETIMGEIGSTLGYKKARKVEPILDVNRIPKNEFKYKKNCRDGILKFQELYYKSFKKMQFDGDIYLRKREILSTLVRFMKYPSYEESINLLNLHHDDNFGTKTIRKFYEDKDFELIKNMEIEEFLFKAKHKNVIWPEAEVSLKNPTYLQQKIIREGYNMPRYYKEVSEIIEKLKRDKVNSVIIWGAGEVGRICIQFLRKEKINIVAIVDRKEWLWNTYIHEIQICSPETVIKNYNSIRKNVLVASFGFIDEIKNSINTYLNDCKVYTLL